MKIKVKLSLMVVTIVLVVAYVFPISVLIAASNLPKSPNVFHLEKPSAIGYGNY